MTGSDPYYVRAIEHVLHGAEHTISSTHEQLIGASA